MIPKDAKAMLVQAAHRAWPNLAKASELPFPDYWKAVTEWLTFHAPHIGDALMWKLIDDFAVSAKEAEERGQAPVPPKVSDEVKAIWAKADAVRTAKAEEKKEAWEHAAERAAEVKNRFTAPFSGPKPSSFRQGSLGSW